MLKYAAFLLKVMLNKKDWTVHFHEQFMHFMNAYGIGTSDILYVPFGYGLYIAWWGFQAALEQVGELVLSNLCTETMPLIRYRIKDLVKFNRKPCECSRTFLRLDGGILGHSDDMFQY